jgi:CheY-like chemotaxis protein
VRFDCSGQRVRAKITVEFEQIRPTALADATTHAVAAFVEAAVCRRGSAEAAMGAELEIAEGAFRSIPAKMGVRAVEISVHADAASGTRRRVDARSMGAGRGRILVVDDHAGARDMLKGVLEPEFDVVVAEDFASAQDVLDAAPIDVVLSDYDMPGGTGIELLRRAQSARPGVIGMLITGHDEYATLVTATTDPSIFRVLRKPYDPEALLSSVRSAFTLAHVRQATARVSLA